MQQHQLQLRKLGGVLRGSKRRVSAAMDDAAAEAVLRHAQADGDEGGSLLVPRSVRVALGSLEKSPVAPAGTAVPHKRGSDVALWAADAAAQTHAPIVPMRGGGGGFTVGAGSGVRRLVGAGVEDTGAPQVR